jgi:hypothetical protein
MLSRAMITRLSRAKPTRAPKAVKQKIKKRDALVSGGAAIMLDAIAIAILATDASAPPLAAAPALRANPVRAPR